MTEADEQREIERDGNIVEVKLEETDDGAVVTTHAEGKMDIYEFDSYERARTFFHALDSQVIGHYSPLYKVNMEFEFPSTLTLGAGSDTEAVDDAVYEATTKYDLVCNILEPYINWDVNGLIGERDN